MKSLLSAIAAFALSTSISAHTIFQQLSINGAQQGQLVAVRSPSTNNPVYDVTTNDIICNTGLQQPVSTVVANVKAGDQIGALWGHIIGGAQGNNDPDNPIASSHHGPISVYMAKVSNAATAAATPGLKWFKIWEDGFDTSNRTWGVDHMIANKGWTNFNIPTCIAPGNYLLRVELIALHSAYASKGAQFYFSCAQINVAGSTGTVSPSTVSFPGAYPQNDPGILINIYGSTGQPDNDGKSYAVPGPAPMIC